VDVEAAAQDEVLLFPEAGTNTVLEFGDSAGDGSSGAEDRAGAGRDGDTNGDGIFAGCEVVVSQRLVNQRLAAVPMEVRGAAAAWDGGGRLHLWASIQNPHEVRTHVAGVYGVEPEQVRIVAPDVGGGFGPKIGLHSEELLLPWLARRLGRPVRWHESRSENLTAMSHGRAQLQRIELGGRRDGTIEAYRLTVLQDSGAYASGYGAFLPYLTRMMAPGPYAIPRVEVRNRSVVTTTPPTHAYRGAGRPEATAAIERAVDLFAAEIGRDPAEVRRQNLVTGPYPYTTAVGTTYDCGDYPRALQLALDAAGYDRLRAQQRARRASRDPVAMGIGVACYVEVTAGPAPGGEFARVDVDPGGAVTVYTGSLPQGQGHATSFAMLAADTLGVPLDRVTVVYGDTDRVSRGQGTYGSRSLQVGGAAVHQAASEVLDQARELAGELLEAGVEDVVLDKSTGRFHVAGAPAVAVTWAQVAAAAADRGVQGLTAETDLAATASTFPFGAHVAVVEVDTETGRADLRRLVAVDDAGRVLNPVIVEGQRHGGIAQGVAQALFEEMAYDPDGNPLTATLADYAMVSAAELPSFELVPMETPTPVNALGAKGIGESGTIGATPAVQSAVCDALGHLGVRHVDLPCTPQRIWQVLQAAAATASRSQGGRVP
jgi:carbon-monoxide dehydrogenase large subunit